MHIDQNFIECILLNIVAYKLADLCSLHFWHYSFDVQGVLAKQEAITVEKNATKTAVQKLLYCDITRSKHQGTKL